MIATSLTVQQIPKDVFPDLIIRSCMSEATESLNGPRYAAQDEETFDVYEVRYMTFDNDLNLSQSMALERQQDRIEQLRLAAQHSIPFVSFPQSVFLCEQTKNDTMNIAAVESFSGLTLGDIVRSGWTLIEESLLNDVLEAAAGFGMCCPLLPPHGNLSADAVKQQLTVRETTVEASKKSRWVIGDWLLTDVNENCDLHTSLADMEWMLTSTFSQFRIQRYATGGFLSPADLEERIGSMINRVKDEHSLRFSGISQICTFSGSSLEDELSRLYRRRAAHSAPLNKARPPQLSTKEKIAFYQATLREEQQHLNRYRRHHALLPPRPLPPGEALEYDKVEELYAPSWLTSPLTVKSNGFSCVDSLRSVSKSLSGMDERSNIVDDLIRLLSQDNSVEQQRKAHLDEVQKQREALRSTLMRSTAFSHSRRSSLTGRSDEASNASSAGFFPHSLSKVAPDVLSVGTNPNSRRRTLNEVSRGVRRGSTGVPERSMNSSVTSGRTGLTGSSDPPFTHGKITMQRKREQVNTPVSGTGSVASFASAESSFVLASSVPSLTAEGVNVPPQHSVRASPRSVTTSESSSSSFPAAPKSIMLGEPVPPRRTLRGKPKHLAHLAVARPPPLSQFEPFSKGGKPTAGRLPTGILQAASPERSSLFHSTSQGVRSFCQELPKTEKKKKGKKHRKSEVPDGVTIGNIRTVTESSITVPRTHR